MAFKQQFQLNKMFRLRSTIYATQFFFMLSLSNLVLGKAEPYLPGIGTSVFNGQPIFNEHRDYVLEVLDNLGYLNNEEDLRKRILEALQDRWQLMVKNFRRSKLERGPYNLRSLRKLRL